VNVSSFGAGGEERPAPAVFRGRLRRSNQEVIDMPHRTTRAGFTIIELLVDHNSNPQENDDVRKRQGSNS